MEAADDNIMVIPVIHGVRTIELTQGFSTIIDEGDFERISRHRWKILKSGNNLYGCRTKMLPGKTESGKRKSKTILLHREIVGAEDIIYVDHKDRDSLNNTRENIRTCTNTQNSINVESHRGESKFKGVSPVKGRSCWLSQIGNGKYENGKQRVINLGIYNKEEDAAIAYDRKARELYGEFAFLNFPDGDDGRILDKNKKEWTKERRKMQKSSAKLTIGQVIEAKQMIKDGISDINIAKKFSVCKNTVVNIRIGKTWTNFDSGD